LIAAAVASRLTPMAKKPTKQRPRTEARIRERDARRLVRDRQKLALLEPGGAAERPIEVTSSSVIAVRARSIRCPLCDGELRMDEELAESATLRAAQMTCVRCGVRRSLWFAIRAPLLN
jgi:hypothetical protein